MKTITSPVPVTAETPSLSAQLADLRRRSKTLAEYMAKLAEMYRAASDEQAEIDFEAQQIEDHITYLESLVQYRDESHRSRRRHKKFDRLAACQHRNNGLSSLSDATHVKLTTKARRKARRDRESDKSVSQIRGSRQQKLITRGLNPAEILILPVKRKDREAYFAELAESRRVAIIAACTDPVLVAQNLNGECHGHYGS